VVVVLVLVALTLITISFRSPTSGALHSVQGAGSTALRPFQVAATRVAQPFRDGYDYLTSLSSAKSQNERLKKEVEELRTEVIANRALGIRAAQLEKILHFERGKTFPGDYRAIATGVISPPSGPFSHTMTIDAGSNAGIRMNSPVVSGDGLVGIVSNVFPETAKVTLLSDSYVNALDVQTRVSGGVRPGTGGTLELAEVSKQKVVHKGDVLVTAGTRNANYPDLYPYGIPIGRVWSVGAQDTASFLQVQVQPFANVTSLDAVAVLVPKNPRR
jgi:rod shape-determining protein MreC